MSNFPTIQGVAGSLQEALQTKVQVSSTTAGGGVQHIKYDSYSGEWSVGKENDDISGDQVTIITDSFCHGWHLWCDREVTKAMASFVQPLPGKPDTQTDRKGKAQEANLARGFQCVWDDDGESTQMSWEHATDGCRRAIDGVMDEVKDRSATEAEFLYPVVTLGHQTPYENPYKDGEMIFPPSLEIVGWRNRDGEDEEAAPKKLAKPKGGKKAAAAEAVTTEAEAAADREEPEAEAEPTTRRKRKRKSA